jgi:hypothetical protein
MLGSNFESFVTPFSMRQPSTTMTSKLSLLLAHKDRIQANLKSTITPSAHLTSSSCFSDKSNPQARFTSGPNSKNNSGQYVNYTPISQGYKGRGSLKVEVD